MQYTVPHYYKKFTCLSGDCPDTCCAGWQIQIDPVSLKKYRKTEGPLGARLHNEIDWEESCFRQYNGRCAFLNEENLCDLYTEGGGEKAFCRTCRTYPRHIEEFEGLREISLSLSCPAAARLILECQEPVRFLHKKNDKEENEPDFDYLLFTKLTDARALIFHILQDRSRPVELRLAVSLALAHDLQVCIHRDALFDCDDLFDRYRSPGVWDWFQRRLNGKETFVASLRDETLKNLFEILDYLEVLRPGFTIFRKKAEEAVFQYNADRQARTGSDAGTHTGHADAAFRQTFTDIITEQLMIYFLFTYFAGAVYDGDAWGKMKFSFVCVVLIRELFRAECIWAAAGTDKIPDVSLECLRKTAGRFARELEHSDLNKDMLEKKLKKEKKFSLRHMLALIS